MGSALASTWESGAWQNRGPQQQHNTVFDPTNPPPDLWVKPHRGQASKSYQRDYGQDRPSIEGVETWLTYQGDTVQTVMNFFRGGIRSAISYLGLLAISELNPNNIEMVRITPNAYLEGTPKCN